MSTKVLSVRQPWADLLVQGVKDVENRSWFSSYRGPLYIHAAKTYGRDEREDFQDLIEDGIRVDAPTRFGGIIGIVTVFDCTREQRSRWHNRGYFGWYVRNAVEFRKMVPCRGELGLFDMSSDVACQVADVLKGKFGWSASDWDEWRQERAAILEYDAGLSRDEAEAMADEMAAHARREQCYGYSAPGCDEYVERVEPRQPVYEHLEPER